MSFTFVRPLTLNLNNQTYRFPEINVPNSIKFEYLKHLMTKYNPQEFMLNFDRIFNQQIEWQPVMYAMFTIARQFFIEFEDGVNVVTIAARLQQHAKLILRRKNSARFHTQFVPFVCLWMICYIRDLEDEFNEMVAYYDYDFIKRVDWIEFLRDAYE